MTAIAKASRRVVELVLGDAASGPRSHPSGQALLRVLAAGAVSIAIAGCHKDTPQEEQDRAFEHCILATAGMFHAATPEILSLCERRTRPARNPTDDDVVAPR